eukprot:5318144-Pyramimonas_sp.AAC.1
MPPQCTVALRLAGTDLGMAGREGQRESTAPTGAARTSEKIALTAGCENGAQRHQNCTEDRTHWKPTRSLRPGTPGPLAKRASE